MLYAAAECKFALVEEVFLPARSAVVVVVVGKYASMGVRIGARTWTKNERL